jgi:O-antigen/teichoic acid export membrane protein
MSNKNQLTKESLRLIVKSSFIIFIGLVIGKLLSYVYRVIVARHFGPEIYGLFSLTVMVAGWFVAICSFGLSDGLLRFSSVYRGKNEVNKLSNLFSKSLNFLLIGGVVSGTVLFISSDFIAITLFQDVRLAILLKIVSISIPLSIILGPYLSLLLAFEKPGTHSFIVNVLQNVLSVGTLVLLLWAGVKDNSIIWAYVLSIATMLVVAYILSHKYIPKEVFRKPTAISKDAKVFRDLFAYSWPRMFQAIVSTIFIGIDSFMLGYFKGAYDVGLYNVAVPIAFLLGFAPDLFMRLFFPIITKNYAKKDFKLIRNLSQQVGKWILMLNLPLFLLIIVFPGAIINTLFGAEFLPAAMSLRLLGIGMFSYSITLVAMSLISMMGKSKVVLYNFIFATVCNSVLNLYLVSRFGLNGAALAATISYIFLGAAFFIQTKTYLKITPLRIDMLKVLLAGAISVTVLFIFSSTMELKTTPELLISVFIFGIIYLSLLFLFKCFDDYDRDILNSILKRVSKK